MHSRLLQSPALIALLRDDESQKAKRVGEARDARRKGREPLPDDRIYLDEVREELERHPRFPSDHGNGLPQSAVWDAARAGELSGFDGRQRIRDEKVGCLLTKPANLVESRDYSIAKSDVDAWLERMEADYRLPRLEGPKALPVNADAVDAPPRVPAPNHPDGGGIQDRGSEPVPSADAGDHADADAVGRAPQVTEQQAALARSALARKGADASHAENRELKAQALEHYENHRAEYANKNEAADAITKVVPAKFATVRDWLKRA